MLTYQLMKAHVPAPGVQPDWAWCLAMIPGFDQLERAPQDKVFHAEGNVLIHTMMVVMEMVNSDAYRDATEEERFILFYSALLHDIAKPATTVIDPDTGKIGQPGHSRRGALDARIMLWRAMVPFAIREAICRLISVHQVPFFAIAGNKSGQSAEFLVRKLSHEMDLHLLAALAEADMRGRHYVGKEDCLVDIELFRELAREEGCYRQPKAFADDHTRTAYFRGAGISPDHAYHKEPGSTVRMMCGLQASGKDTWVAKNAPGVPVVSFDAALEGLGLRHGKNNGKAVHFAIDYAKELLRAKVPFVWNATHLSAQMRKKTLDLLYNYNAEVEIVYLEQQEKTLFARNSRRDTSLPNKVIEKMLFRWEVPLPTEANKVTYLAA